MRRLLALTLLATAIASPAQTLARPGWAGSGITVERWWPHAVLCEVTPGSLADLAPGDSTFTRLRSHLEDLQTLGVDAVLLQGLQPRPDPSGPAPGAASIDPRYGTREDFDALVTEAVRRGIRVLVALPHDAHEQTLVSDARLWLSRGATGLALSSDNPQEIQSLRAVLHSYVGDRILIADRHGTAANTIADPPPQQSRNSIRAKHAPTAQAGQPDLQHIRLPALDSGAGPLRAALEQSQAMLSAHTSVPLLSAAEERSNPAAAKVLATALLGVGGVALLSIDDLDLAHAADTAHPSLFAWVRQGSGLHRGNPIMRSGSGTLLDHDAEGALVWVRQGRGPVAPIVSICNVTEKPIRLSLVSDAAQLHLRGSFLRTLARSDGGMGAMPLRSIVLPAFGVYVGELSR